MARLNTAFNHEDEQSTAPISHPLTEKCHHYTHISQVPWDIQKYWHQRRSIFSLYDEGIQMTDDAWFGVTPEPVAYAVAADLPFYLPSDPQSTVLIDLFGGAGGNSIAFASSGHWARVVSLELDIDTIACAQHNATIYGVHDAIEWVHADCFQFLDRLRARWASRDGQSGANRSKKAGLKLATSSMDDIDAILDRLDLRPSSTVIFASPPWGGPGYSSDAVFDLSTMLPYSLQQIFSACSFEGGRLPCALYLPRTSDLRQIAKLQTRSAEGSEVEKIEVVHYCMEGASKALVAYVRGKGEE